MITFFFYDNKEENIDNLNLNVSTIVKKHFEFGANYEIY